MRNKLLNKNRNNLITSGNLLNRTDEIPVLNEAQLQQADLVRRLPKDFPFAQWDNMYTKQQLR